MNKKNSIYWPYIILAYTSLFSLGLLDMGRGPFFPDILLTLGLTEAKGALIFSVASFSALLGSYFSQRTIGKVPSIWGIRTALFALSLGFWGMAQVTDFSALMVWCVVFGVGIGVGGVFQHVVVQEGANDGRRRQLLSGLHSTYAVAALLAPLLASVLQERGIGWRWGFVAASSVPAFFFLLSFLVKPKTSKDFVDHGVPLPKGQRRKFVYIGMIIGFYMSGELVASTRMTLLLRKAHELSPEVASSYLAVFFVLLLLGRLTFTVFTSQRFGGRVILSVCLAMSFLLLSIGLSVNPLFFVASGLFMAPVMGVAMDFVSELFKSKASVGMAYGMTLGALVVVPAHYFVGVLGDQIGVSKALYIAPAMHLLALILVICQRWVFSHWQKV